MKKMGNDQRGMSLVELIIVITMMAVLTATLTFGTGILTSKRVDSGAQQLLVSLQNARSHALGKGNNAVRAVLKRDTDGNVMLEETINGTTKTVSIGRNDLTISYKLKGSDTEIILAETEEMVFHFDRSSGVLKPNADNTVYSAVMISKGSRKKVIEIEAVTGRISLK